MIEAAGLQGIELLSMTLTHDGVQLCDLVRIELTVREHIAIGVIEIEIGARHLLAAFDGVDQKSEVIERSILTHQLFLDLALQLGLLHDLIELQLMIMHEHAIELFALLLEHARQSISILLHGFDLYAQLFLLRLLAEDPFDQIADPMKGARYGRHHYIDHEVMLSETLSLKTCF